MAESARGEAASLVRGLTTFDGALITIGSVLGSAIFLAAADVGRAVPHPSLIMLVWALGGLVTLAGALTYAELGAMFPRAGGQYHFLKEAYGPVWGFLFGWTAFLVIMSGGLAALAVGFGKYLGVFVPFFSTDHVFARQTFGTWVWTLNGGQLAGALALALLTAINYFGLEAGTWVQNAVTLLKVLSLLALGGLGLLLPAPVAPDWSAALPSHGVLSAIGVGMIAVLWSYDGWYGLTYLTGEMRDPQRGLPRGMVWGCLAVTAFYLLMNLVYLRALPVAQFAGTERIGEAAASALFGPRGAQAVALAVLVSIFGCLATTVLYCARIYLPMAEDGVFFAALAQIHPRFRTPSTSILAQGFWAIVLTFSGTYEQLYTYVVFAMLLFHAMTGAAVLVLRRTRPEAPRPYRTWGYPLVPILFVGASLAFVANSLLEQPHESLFGLGLVALGLPAYAWWRHSSRRP